MSSSNQINSLEVGAGLIGLGAVLLVGWWVVCGLSEPEPASKARSEERAKILSEVSESQSTLLNSFAWVDQPKGIVRLPIDVAMSKVAEEWADPAKGHALLKARSAKLQGGGSGQP